MKACFSFSLDGSCPIFSIIGCCTRSASHVISPTLSGLHIPCLVSNNLQVTTMGKKLPKTFMLGGPKYGRMGILFVEHILSATTRLSNPLTLNLVMLVWKIIDGVLNLYIYIHLPDRNNLFATLNYLIY